MTKIQMQERIEKDDKMCRKINRILDDLYSYKMGYPEAVGGITAHLEMAGRREESPEVAVLKKAFEKRLDEEIKGIEG